MPLIYDKKFHVNFMGVWLLYVKSQLSSLSVMKKLLLLLALLSFPVFLIAQNLNGSFKIDIDGGYVKPTEGYGVNPGVVLTLEPRVYLSDYFTAGLRLEGALIGVSTSI